MGPKAALFEASKSVFLQAITAFLFKHMQEPNTKTVKDRLTRLIQQLREKVKENADASCIIEKYGEIRHALVIIFAIFSFALLV